MWAASLTSQGSSNRAANLAPLALAFARSNSVFWALVRSPLMRSRSSCDTEPLSPPPPGSAAPGGTLWAMTSPLDGTLRPAPAARRAAASPRSAFGHDVSCPRFTMASTADERQTKTTIGARLGWRVGRAIGRALITRAAAKASTAIDSFQSGGRAFGIHQVAARVGAVPVAAPLPQVARRVVETPAIGFLPADRPRSARARAHGEPLAGIAIGAVRVIPGDAVEDTRTLIGTREWPLVRRTCGAGTGCVFPLRLRRQAVVVALRQARRCPVTFRQSTAELDRVQPAHVVHGQIVVLVREVLARVDSAGELHEGAQRLFLSLELVQRVIGDDPP